MTRSASWTSSAAPARAAAAEHGPVFGSQGGELNTQRRLQFADGSLDLKEPTPRCRAGRANTVSLQEGIPRPAHANDVEASKKAATPKKRSKSVEQQENWTPNRHQEN
ncbi:hypothetical protein PC121_g16728 [Phytophthora cactorum]|nr:hypothetical protein PC120_g15959 [Phytophthora cactorum]KAG3053580.1 hypothetical protein PC121_g16728 [Phytophthora cactorum]